MSLIINGNRFCIVFYFILLYCFVTAVLIGFAIGVVVTLFVIGGVVTIFLVSTTANSL